MKLSKKEENELLQVYNTWWDSYLNGDLEIYNSYLDDEFRFVGSTDGEEFLNKSETTSFLKATADQLAGKAKLENVNRNMESFEGMVLFTDLADAYILDGKEWVYYARFRFTSLMHKTSNGWRFFYQHFSTPDLKAEEGETLGHDKVSNENLELRNAIKRKTAELVIKNRDLEVEASLQRVRSQVMAMQESADLLDLVVTMRNEFTRLGHHADYFWHMTWLEDKFEKSMTSGDGSRIGTIMELPRDFHSHYEGMDDWEANEEPVMVLALETEEALDYLHKMVTLGDFKQVDSNAPTEEDIRHIGGITFVMARTSHGEIGYSLPGVVKKPPKKDLLILERFAKVFDLAYRRFLDLQKAEKQARVVEIELSLEKVRSRTMAMQHSDELLDVASVMFQQIKALGVPQWNCGFNIWEMGDKECTYYPGSPDGKIIPFSCKIPLNDHPVFKRFEASKKRGEELLIYEKEGEEQKDHYEYMLSLPGVGDFLRSMMDADFELPTFQIDHVANFAYGNLLFITYEHFPEMHEVFKKFAKVFEQTYTRFLDLQKAEAQAREALIEASLERVRSRTMGMHNSGELKEVIQILFDQIHSLNINIYATGVGPNYKDSDDFHIWTADIDHTFPTKIRIPYFEHPLFYNFKRAKKLGLKVYSNKLTFEEKNRFWDHCFKHLPAAQELKDVRYDSPGYASSSVLLDNIQLFIFNLEGIPYSEDELVILMRFGKVFEQTYARFLDLKKAEQQAREATVEAAIERVRARSMAMHRSKELTEVAILLQSEFKELGINQYFETGYIIIDEENEIQTLWMSDFDGSGIEGFTLPLTGDKILQSRYDAWKRKDSVYCIKVEGEELLKHIDFVLPLIGSEDVALQVVNDLPDPMYLYSGNFSNGFLTVVTERKINDEQVLVLERFAKVFEQTYTRFLDLQKAEEQAKEALIEAGLERIRSKSMSMSSSEDIGETVATLFEELVKIGHSKTARTGIGIFDDSKYIKLWSAITDPDDEAVLRTGQFDMTLNPSNIKVKKAWEDGEKDFYFEMKGPELTDYYKTINEAEDYELKIDLKDLPEKEYWYQCYFKYGIFYAIDKFHISEETKIVFTKFAKVFEQIYTRFLDLQKAEEQARKAQIEAALERVRARSMAMHETDELHDVLSVLFQQFDELEIKPISAFLSLFDLDKNEFTYRTTSKAGSRSQTDQVIYMDAMDHWNEIVTKWKSEKPDDIEEIHYDHDALPQLFEIFDESFSAAPEDERVTIHDFPNGLYALHAYCKFGYLGLNLAQPATNEEREILSRFAREFTRVYQRFLDLQKAEAQARTSQINLAVERVRARAMAMYNSSELLAVVSLLRDEMLGLNIPGVAAATIYLEEDDGHIRMTDLTSIENLEGGFKGTLDIDFKLNETDPNLFLRKVWDGKEEFFLVKQYAEDLVITLKWLREHDPDYALVVENFFKNIEWEYVAHPVVQLNNGKMTVDLLDQEPPAELESIMKKMASAFDLTYTRFLDLQKAEEQAKEAQIEAALERVRSRTMGMINSSELSEVASVLFEQITELNIAVWTTGFNIWSEDDTKYEDWLTSPKGGFIEPYMVDTTQFPVFIEVREAKQRGDDFFVQYVEGENLKKMYAELCKFAPPQFEVMLQDGFEFPKHQYNHFVFENSVSLMFITYESLPEAHDIFRRFGKVFQQTYTRFLDLQKAEAQAKEAQIEASLEKVRSRSLAMQRSNDLSTVIKTISEELYDLNIRYSNVSFGIDSDDSDYVFWTSISGQSDPVKITVPYIDHPITQAISKARKNKQNFLVDFFSSEIHGVWLKHAIENSVLKHITKNEKQNLLNLPLTRSVALLPNIFLVVANYKEKPYSVADNDIIARFGQVFEQAYTRFLDLKKVEAQAREAKIEAALERVRSKTMAMHNSSDVKETVKTFFDQVLRLGIDKSIRCGIGILEGHEGMETWSANANDEGKVEMRVGMLNMSIHPMLVGLKKAWNKGEKGYSYDYSEKDVLKYYTALNNEPEYPFNADLDELPTKEYHQSFFFSSGIIFTFTENPLTEESSLVLNRFAEVFGQTYRRYLDLRNAEAQAREAQIEAALEKVRSRTMAMQASSELQEAANLLFLEVQDLGINAWSAGYNILSEDKLSSRCWMSSEGVLQDPFTLHYHEEASFKEMGEFLKSDQDFLVQELGGKDLEKHYEYMKSFAEMKPIFDHITESGLSLPTYQVNHLCKFSKGFLLFITYESVPKAHDIFKRFTKVFEQTFTRFQDLKKAENQSKEAQIELALERVRASTLAMHKSEQLPATAEVLFEQFDLMGILPDRISIAVYEESKKIFELWATDQNGTLVNQGHDFSIDEPTCMAKIFKAWKAGDDTCIVDLQGRELKEWVQYVKNDAKMAIDESEFEGRRVQHAAFFSHGYLLLSSHTPISDDMMKLLLRFAKVFEQSYMRFLDLTKVEKQAREAIKRASVDRVRAEIASMRTATDLNRITPLIWNELTTLNVPFIRCGVFIMDEERQEVQTHLSSPDGKALASFQLNFNDTEPLHQLLPHWRKKELYIDHWDKQGFIDSTKILMEKGAISSKETYLNKNQPENLHLHFLPFLQGMLYVGSEVPLTEYALSLVQNLAEAFSSAYARYEDFNKLELANKKIEKTLVDLKQAQSQLVQSEKMASLGELTAGIAHEIQNPLNFVNNFSEVSGELMEEMYEEIKNGEVEEALEIGNDIEQNLQKIHHHGQRASEIVKGMLQHSRSSSGERELTDINTLTDEYLRLAYHGLRAKDKTFNAKMDTDFDLEIEKIKVIPQDIGRVILNLITNAFYAVDQKKKQINGDFEPKVEVSTKKLYKALEIKVLDNGNGIPKKVLEKIFQPFFTTKPTGQGTGLGLSLSYDIVTAHGGELKVETKEGKGSEFIIKLPV